MSLTTAAALYARQSESETKELWQIQDGNNTIIPEMTSYYWNFDKPNERVTLKILKDHCFDGRRTWSLFTIWLDDDPVMIVQRAGREGDDHIERFITDAKRYSEMVVYLNSLLQDENQPVPFIDPLEERDDLDFFYGCSLDGVFEYH